MPWFDLVEFLNQDSFKILKFLNRISLLKKESLNELGDSHFCIEFLSKQYNVNLNENLSQEQLAIARAFIKMTEESLNW